MFLSAMIWQDILAVTHFPAKASVAFRGAAEQHFQLTDMAKAVAFARAKITLCSIAEYFYLHSKPKDNSQCKPLHQKKRTAKKFCTRFSENSQNRGLENDKEHNNLSLSADETFFVQHFLLRLVFMVFVHDGRFNSR